MRAAVAIVIFAWIIFLLTGCDPIKRVVKDPVKFEKMKEIVIRANACINDTVTIETIKDSVVYKDSIIETKVQVPCKDFDTTMADGSRISVSSGVLTYKSNTKVKEVLRTVVKTNNIRDKAYENILKGDIAKLDSAGKAKDVKISEQKAEIKNLKADVREEKFKFWALIAIAGIIIFRKPLMKLVWPYSR